VGLQGEDVGMEVAVPLANLRCAAEEDGGAMKNDRVWSIQPMTKGVNWPCKCGARVEWVIEGRSRNSFTRDYRAYRCATCVVPLAKKHSLEVAA
jgi:hypothetical protein